MYQGITIKLLLKSIFEANKTSQVENKLKKHLQKYFNGGEIFFFQSGRSALGFLLGNLKKKKFVLVPSFSCEVVPLEVIKRGFVPIYYELNPISKNIKNIININLKNVAAVIYQHSFGVHDDIRPLKKILKKKNIILIEDKALCFLSKNKKLPELQGDAAYYSFEASKTITCTMGGMVLTNNVNFLTPENYNNNLYYDLFTNLRVIISSVLYKIPGDVGFAIRKFFIYTKVIIPSVSKKDLNLKKKDKFYDLTILQKILLLNQLKNIKYLKKISNKNIRIWSKILNFNFRKIFKNEYLPLRLYYYSKNAKKIKEILNKSGLKQADWFTAGMGDEQFNQKTIKYKIRNFIKTVNFCKNNVNLPSLIELNKNVIKNIEKNIKNI